METPEQRQMRALPGRGGPRMEVKGVAFVARQQMMVQAHGEEAWRKFLADHARKDPLFAQPVMPVARLPVDSFLRLHDALVQRFYRGDTRVYRDFGVDAARYALSQGPLKRVFAPGDFRRFLLYTPSIWKSYFTEGEVLVSPEDRYTELRVLRVPRPHPYFELSLLGFVEGGLMYLGVKELRHETIKGFSKGHSEVVFRFHIT